MANAVLQPELPKIEQKRLLSILGELNELELKILFAHSLHFKHGRPEYLAANPEAAQPRPMFPEFKRKNALYESYIAHLEQLRLLTPAYEKQRELSIQDLSRAGVAPPRVTGYSLSHLGRLLLESADLVPREA